jgi:hypothetical protein
MNSLSNDRRCNTGVIVKELCSAWNAASASVVHQNPPLQSSLVRGGNDGAIVMDEVMIVTSQAEEHAHITDQHRDWQV